MKKQNSMDTQTETKGLQNIQQNRQYSQNVVHPDDKEQFNSCFSREAMLRLFREGKKQVSRRHISYGGVYRRKNQ